MAEGHLVFPIAGENLSRQYRQRVVIIDRIQVCQAAPQVAVFQRQAAPETPQWRLRQRNLPPPVSRRLRMAGDQPHARLQSGFSQCLHQRQRASGYEFLRAKRIAVVRVQTPQVDDTVQVFKTLQQLEGVGFFKFVSIQRNHVAVGAMPPHFICQLAAHTTAVSQDQPAPGLFCGRGGFKWPWLPLDMVQPLFQPRGGEVLQRLLAGATRAQAVYLRPHLAVFVHKGQVGGKQFVRPSRAHLYVAVDYLSRAAVHAEFIHPHGHVDVFVHALLWQRRSDDLEAGVQHHGVDGEVFRFTRHRRW